MDEECMEKQLDSRSSPSKAQDSPKGKVPDLCTPAPTTDGSEGVLRYEMSCLRSVLDAETHGGRWLTMCIAVQESNWSKAFSVWSSSDTNVIVDVQVLMTDSEESVPSGYEILKSVSGAEGDINKKTGGRIIHLCARRTVYRPPSSSPSSDANQITHQDPITALSVVCDDQYQEAPLGFTNIERTVGGRSADLSLGNGAQRMFLCHIRGTGPPINNLVLLFNSRKETPPPGYHKLVKTANDDTADLSSLCKTGNEVYLCFSLDLQFLIHRFKLDISVDEKWSACAALFVACLFSPSENVVVQSLKSLHELLLMSPGLNVPLGANLMNIIFHALCDCLILARSHFTRSVQSLGLQVLLDSFLKYVYELRLETVLRVYETFFFERHKDRREALSFQIAEFLFTEETNQRSSSTQREESETIDGGGSNFDVKSWIKHDLLDSLTDTIDLHKSCSRVINWFQRSKEVNLSFRITISDLLQKLCPRKHVDRLIIGLLLTACKIASHQSLSKQPSKSESIMRKIHALNLILRIISHPSTVDIMTPKGPLLILRRFVCASLLESYVTVVPAVFKLVLSWFTELWQSYRHLLKTELGIIMESVVLGLIQSAYCWPEQKIDLIEAISHLFPTPGNLVDLFYNYDNDIQRRNLFGRLINSLCKICDNQVNPAVIKGAKSKQIQQHPVQAAFLQSAYEANASLINLQRTSLSTVVSFLEHLAEFISPPTLYLDEFKASGSRSSSICLPMLESFVPVSPKPFGKQSSFSSLFANLDSSPTSHKRSQSWCETEAEEKQKEMMSRDRRIRSSTWVSRHMQQKKAQLLHTEAITLARSESIKAAVAMLISRRGIFDPDEIAAFFSSNANSLDKTEIGEFIATDFTRHMTSEQFDQLRRSFMAMIDFTSLDLDSALRHFLVHSGFRLPGEAQKVDRLIQAFADAYVRDNPGVFANDEAVYLVAFALIMLNTDMHDPRLRTGKQSRSPMTKAQFIRNLQGVDATMSAALLGALFDGIAARPIEWQNPSSDDPSSVAQITVPADTERNFLKDCTNLSRQGLTWIKTGPIRPRMYLTTDSKHIVKGMFEVIFTTLLGSLSSFNDKSNESDVEIRTTCIDGIKYASVIALATNSQEELDAFLSILAKIAYVEQNKATVPSPQIRKALVAGEHLNQNWVVDLKLLLASRNKKAVNVIVRTANRLKRNIIFERDQLVLLNIQNEFTEELLLVDPERTFVREGHLTKMSSGSRLQLYRFFLFTDLVLYAREQFQKLKVHKVVHLSMCRLMDLPDSENESGPAIKNAFKIISPQKSFTVLAPSQNDKRTWMADIQKHIELCYTQHMKWIEAARSEPLQDHNHSVSELKDESLDPNDSVDGSVNSTGSNQSGSASNLNTSRLMSSFIGRPKGKLLQRGCRFCIRDFAMLRRKCICSWCSQTVCSACSTHRLELPVNSNDSRSPKKLQRVCDACYGHLIGSIEIGKPPEILPANK